MRIQFNDNISYGHLYRGVSIEKALEKKTSAKFQKELKVIEQSIKSNNLHKKENVDIILNYNKSDGFYGTISSKKQGVPMNPNNKQKVSNNEESINRFSEWVNEWDENYSPSKTNLLDEIIQFYKDTHKSIN